jgi:choline dehydrogenase-like flavoprotein
MSASTGLLSNAQFRTLAAICATFIESPESPANGEFHCHVAEDIAREMLLLIAEQKSERDQKKFRQALGLFESRLMNGILTRQPARFTKLNRAGRERVLRAWARSRSGLLRAGFQTLKRLSLFLCYGRLHRQAATNSPWAVPGYPGPLQPVPPVIKTIVPLVVDRATALSADVVVVGSGAGGGVVAAELAAAGYQVIVLEKGGYFNESDFDGAEVASVQRLYEGKGILSTRDLGVVILAGNALGGGTTVNWTTSLRPPDHVLQQWEQECGVKGVAQAEWQASLDAVCTRIHVNQDESTPNPQNQKLIDGCTSLNCRWRLLPRNVRGCRDCGYCGFGCRAGAKQGTLKTFLQDAFDHGTKIIVRCHVHRVTVRDGVAEGVEATVDGHPVTIRAKLVVAAGGSINTPALLLRSGLTHRHIGRNLHLHPVAAVFGLYDEPIEPWRGTMQAVVCDEFANLANGYGFVLETAPAHPGTLASSFPWHDARGHRELMSRAAHAACFIAITRDRDGGRVIVDNRGRPVLDYAVSRHDARHLLLGAQAAVRVHAAAGARTIGGPYQNAPLLRPCQSHDVRDYVRRIGELGVIKNDMILYSAHQMSTCRMGGTRRLAPVRPDGETVEVKNLFVADASALPTATGVNPMISIMALAHRTAQFIKARLQETAP